MERNGKHTGRVWQMQEAKARLSELVKQAEIRPQFITVHGENKAVVISMEESKKRGIAVEEKEMSLWEFLQNSPLKDVDLEIEPRRIEPDREIDLP